MNEVCNMIADEVLKDKDRATKDKTSAPVVNGNNVETLTRQGKQVSFMLYSF